MFDKEYRIKKIDDKQERWVHGLGKLLLNKDGEPIELVGTIQDITWRKKAEDSIMQYGKIIENSLNKIYSG